MKTKYYDWVDYAKGIGIILVVYGHVARGVYNAKMIATDGLYLLVDSVIYSFHMPLFFFLSGLFFVTSLKKRGIKGLMVSKINALVYPYFVWSIIQLIIKLPLASVTNSIVTFRDVYSIIWQPVEQFWFLYSLFLIFLVYSFIHKFTKNTLFTFFISIILFVLQDLLFTPWGIFNSVFQYGIFFCSGMLVNEFIKLPSRDLGLYALVGGVIFSIIQWFYHSSFPVTYGMDKKYLFGFIAFESIACVVFISMFLYKLNSKSIKYIGQFSLEIYLTHIIFASGFRIFFQKLLGFESVIFHLTFGTIVGIVCPIMFVWFIKKIHLPYPFYASKIFKI